MNVCILSGDGVFQERDADVEESGCQADMEVSRNGPERRSGKRIIAGTAFRLEFLVGWYYDADAAMVVPELY